MVKVIAFFKRKAGVSVADFQRHWRTQHAELVVRLPGLRRYVQNHTNASGYRKKEPDFDGVAEAWFDDTDALRVSGSSPGYARVKEDEANFIAADSLRSLITNEIPIVEGNVAEGGAKMIAFLNKRPDISAREFQDHWREKHAPLAARIPGLRRYVQCHVHPGIYEAGREPAYDGVPISWFDDLAALRSSGMSKEFLETRADEPNFMISGRLPFVIADEVEIEI